MTDESSVCDFNAKDYDVGDDDDSRDGSGNRYCGPGEPNKQSLEEMNDHIQNVLQQMKEKFQTMSEQILSKIDNMGTRIDDLEKNISDLLNHAGLETPDK